MVIKQVLKKSVWSLFICNKRIFSFKTPGRQLHYSLKSILAGWYDMWLVQYIVNTAIALLLSWIHAKLRFWDWIFSSVSKIRPIFTVLSSKMQTALQRVPRICGKLSNRQQGTKLVHFAIVTFVQYWNTRFVEGKIYSWNVGRGTEHVSCMHR